MPSTTTHYSFQKPTVGGDSAAWGGYLNANLDSLDSTLFTVQGVANAALPATSYTAADVKAKILTVDGSGSGLDADLLDGHDSTFFTNAGNITAGNLPVAQLPTKAIRHLTSSFTSGNITVSTAAPSGGADGDIWFQV